MNAETLTLIFGAIFGLGAAYMLVSIFFGDLDLDLDLAGAESGLEESLGLSCSVISAFMVAFGSMGLAASLAGVGVFGTLLAASVFGLLMARLVSALFHYVKGREHLTATPEEILIGKIAHPTIHIPAGKKGEAIIEAEENLKYAIMEVDGLPLQRGDITRVVGIENTYLWVKKGD